MSDLSALISLREIVRETIFLAQKGEEDYERFKQYAINGYREFNKHHYNNAKRVKLTMDDNHIISFPDDMIKLLNVYVPVNGTYARLTKRDSLVDTTSLQSGNVTRNEDDGENQDILVKIVGYYTQPINGHGYYTEDKRNGRILFLTDYRTEVILEYISNGISVDDDRIPSVCKQALQAWIMWQNALYDRQYNGMEKETYRQNYIREERLLRQIQMPSLEQLKDEWNNNSTQGIRR